MKHETKVINGFTVHYFDEFKDAHSWLRDLQGEDAQFISLISITNITIWATDIDPRFDGKQYKTLEISDIIARKDAKALQKIHPMYFLVYKRKLTTEEMDFLAESLTYKQLEQLPNTIFNKFTEDELNTLLNRFKTKKSNHYKLYTLKKEDPSEKTVFVQVIDDTVVNTIKKKIKYARRYGNKGVDQEIDKKLDFRKEYLNANEICRYLGIGLEYLTYMKNHDIKNNLYPYMGYGETIDGKLMFKTDDFIKAMKANYHPINDNLKNDKSRWLPENGFYSRDEMITIFKVEKTCSRKGIEYAMQSGKLSYMLISDRFYRISKRDFEDYLVNRVDMDLNFVVKNMRERKVIQFPKNATEEQKDMVVEQYITEDNLLNILGYKDRLDKDHMGYGFQSSMWKSLSDASEKYLNRFNGRLYRKKEDINNWLRDHYKTDNGKGETAVALHIDYDLLVKAYEKDKDGFGDLCRTTSLEEYCKKKYPNLNPDDFATKVIRWISNGKIPVFYFSKKFRYVYMPDLKNLKEFEEYINIHKN